jgi:hypothetical protein
MVCVTWMFIADADDEFWVDGGRRFLDLLCLETSIGSIIFLKTSNVVEH